MPSVWISPSQPRLGSARELSPNALRPSLYQLNELSYSSLMGLAVYHPWENGENSHSNNQFSLGLDSLAGPQLRKTVSGTNLSSWMT